MQIASIPDRQGQLLRNRLELLFNPSGAVTPEVYRLAITLSTNSQDALVRRDETATRLDQTLVADYTLTSLQDQRVVTRGRARAVNGFDVVESDYATVTAERNALNDNLSSIAQSIQAQLAVFFERRAQALPAQPPSPPKAVQPHWDPRRGRIPEP